METFILISGIVLILLGALGSFLPVLPGPPIAYAALFLRLFGSDENRINTQDLLIYGVVVVVITLIDYYLPIWGTKKFGGSNAGKRGSFWGMIIGLVLLTPITGPLSIVIGPLLGAYIGELLIGNSQKMAIRSAWGSFLGFAAGTALKIAYCVAVLWKFL